MCNNEWNVGRREPRVAVGRVGMVPCPLVGKLAGMAQNPSRCSGLSLYLRWPYGGIPVGRNSVAKPDEPDGISVSTHLTLAGLPI